MSRKKRKIHTMQNKTMKCSEQKWCRREVKQDGGRVQVVVLPDLEGCCWFPSLALFGLCVFLQCASCVSLSVPVSQGSSPFLAFGWTVGLLVAVSQSVFTHIHVFSQSGHLAVPLGSSKEGSSRTRTRHRHNKETEDSWNDNAQSARPHGGRLHQNLVWVRCPNHVEQRAAHASGCGCEGHVATCSSPIVPHHLRESSSTVSVLRCSAVGGSHGILT